MADSICKRCFHSYVCEQFNEHRDCDDERCHFFNDHFVDADSVVVREKGGSGEIVIKPDGIHPLSPHQFVEEEHLRNVTVQILRCKNCGHVSIGWHRQDNTEEVENNG